MTEWESEKRVQDDYLRSQLAGLSKATPAVRRRFQILVVRCRGCGDVPIEILKLDPYAVILSRRTKDHPSAATSPATASVDDHIERFKTRLAPIRLDEHWMLEPIVWPLRDEDTGGDPGRREYISGTCRCRRREPGMTKRFLFDAIRAGKKKITLPQRVE